MILADTRSRLTSNDRQLVMLLLSRGSAVRRARIERQLAEEGIDPLLDSPELFERLLTVRSMLMPSPPLFYYVAVRHLLMSAGTDDRALADYIASMVLEFGQRDRAWRVDWNDDHQHQYVVDILADLSSSQGPRQFKVMVHLGNYALWLVGVFPDYVAARRLRKGGPDVDYYERLGQHGYQLASDHELADRFGMEPILRSAADRFSQVRQALNRLSDRCLFPNRCSPDRVLRELEGPA
jgi:hypothetical protein